MNLRFATVVAAAALLSACATAPAPLQGSFTQVNPRDSVGAPQVGAPVRWGGRIISTAPIEKFGAISTQGKGPSPAGSAR